MRELYPGEIAGILEPFRDHGVNAVLVGGAAAWTHGVSQRPHDVDLVVQATRQNLENAAVALRTLNARPPDYSHYLDQDSIDALPPVHLDALTLAAGDTFWETRHGGIDLFHSIATPGAELHYEQLAQTADRRSVAGVTMPVASIDMVIASKTFAGRGKDRPVVDELHRIRLGRHREPTAQPARLANRLDPPGPPRHHGPEAGPGLER